MKLLFLILLIFSCSQVQKKARNGDDSVQDFRVQEELKYSSSQDYLKVSSSFFSTTTYDYEQDLKDDEISKVVQLCRQKKVNSGLTYANRSYGKYKEWPSFWNAIGLCYYLDDQLYQARLFFNRALNTFKDYAPSLNNLGLVNIKEKRWDEALIAFKEAYKSNPNSQAISYNLGRFYSAFGHGSKALIYYKKIDDIDIYKNKVRPLMAIAYSQSGEHQEAIKLFQSNSNSSIGEKLFMAKSYLELGDKKNALSLVSEISLQNDHDLWPLLEWIKNEVRG
jgi:tetratricopeptide (TPR) repeat protein